MALAVWLSWRCWLIEHVVGILAGTRDLWTRGTWSGNTLGYLEVSHFLDESRE